MSNELTQQDPASMVGTADFLFRDGMMETLERFSTLMSKGRSTIPQHFQGNPADCMAVVMQAAQWRMNPFAVAQKTHLVQGTLGYESQLVNAVITSMAPTKDRLHYDWYGDWSNVIGNFVEKTSGKGSKYIAPGWSLVDEKGCGVRVWATLKGEDEPRYLDLLLSQAQVRNSTLWATDPKQQLGYLAVKRWSRLYVPDVIMGVYTPDELETLPRDMGNAQVVSNDRPASAVSALKQKLGVSEQEGEPSTLQSVLESIKDARDKAELDLAVKPVPDFSQADKKKARAAYVAKRKELTPPAAAGTAVDMNTGEILKGEVNSEAFSMPDVENMITRAENGDDLDTACDLIRDLPVDRQASARKLAIAQRQHLEG